MDHYDLIVIGSGPGGASLAHRLAPTGKRILLIERGDYLPRSQATGIPRPCSWTAPTRRRRLGTASDGETFHPGLHYFVGGNSKVYGAALFRLRERDFEAVQHKDGVSPAWPLKYADFEPFYTEAEQLFAVHGQRGEDPLEPPATGAYPFPPVSHEPRIQELNDTFASEGLHPFHLPLGIQARREGRQADPHQHLHPLRRVRRLSPAC